LNQILPITRQRTGKHGLEYPLFGQMVAQGEFRGLARWVTSPLASDKFTRAISPERPGIDANGEDPGDVSGGLGALLASIADEVHAHAAAAREGVMADFAARVLHARKHFSRSLLVATLASIREQRKAALALVNRNAALEIAGRQKAAIAAFGGNSAIRRRKPRGGPSKEQAPRP
jgi:hypothetical protein